jgi:hypothetical protein
MSKLPGVQEFAVHALADPDVQQRFRLVAWITVSPLAVANERALSVVILPLLLPFIPSGAPIFRGR